MNGFILKRQPGNRYLTLLVLGVFISSVLVSNVFAGPDDEFYESLEHLQ